MIIALALLALLFRTPNRAIQTRLHSPKETFKVYALSLSIEEYCS